VTGRERFAGERVTAVGGHGDGGRVEDQLCTKRRRLPSVAVAPVQVTVAGRSIHPVVRPASAHRSRASASTWSGTVPTCVIRPCPVDRVVIAGHRPKCGCRYEATTLAPSGFSPSTQRVAVAPAGRSRTPDSTARGLWIVLNSSYQTPAAPASRAGIRSVRARASWSA
jgi:hypothetical protein